MRTIDYESVEEIFIPEDPPDYPYELIRDKDWRNFRTVRNAEKVTTTSSGVTNLYEWRGNALKSLNVQVGLMFASKAFVQLLTNPIVGPLTAMYVELLLILKMLSIRYIDKIL